MENTVKKKSSEVLSTKVDAAEISRKKESTTNKKKEDLISYVQIYKPIVREYFQRES